MRRPAVALLIETSNSYARGLLEGIVGYVRAHDPWSIWLPEQRRGEPPPEWLKRWRGDGIIARIETEEIARIVRQTKLPVVDVSAARPLTTVPWVETDDRAIAQLAVEHLAERGFRRVAFVGEEAFNWSRYRAAAFVEAAQERGLQCAVAPPITPPSGRTKSAIPGGLLRTWLTSLETPVGIFCCYDIKAQQVLDLCRELDLAVPEQVAVLGVDNDPLLCNLCTPPLSSIAPNTYRTGYVAAELLERLLRGESVPAQPTLVPPLGIETRLSTETLAIEDDDVARALRFIRERAREGIDVSDVLRAVPISRRVLEARFQKLVGRSPHAEIVRIRLLRVRQMLTETDLPLREIARRTGFRHTEYLSVAFKRQYGVSPSTLREPRRAGDSNR
jgi:LacI family transcriptional regulator